MIRAPQAIAPSYRRPGAKPMRLSVTSGSASVTGVHFTPPGVRRAKIRPFRLTMDVTNLFFDRQSVINAVGKAKRKVLSHAGGLVRKIARRSMRRPSKKGPQTSAPGQPPKVHEGGLKRLLFYSYDPASRSAVIGPTPYAGRPGTGTRRGAPRALEFGGYSSVIGYQRGTKVRRKRYIRRRPYMAPALQKVQPMLPAMWRGAVRG